LHVQAATSSRPKRTAGGGAPLQRFKESIRELIVETAANLPADVRQALRQCGECEWPRSRAALALDAIALNVDMAARARAPLCQDTGLLRFEIYAPVDADQLAIYQGVGEAVAEATRLGKLRPNSVDPLSGHNREDNLGPGTPSVHVEQWLADDVEVRLLLKGGGCENQSAQYALPCELPQLGRAERDLEGVRRCVLHAVHAAQGQGCSAGIVGVAIGGDRAGGYRAAERQLFRRLDDRNHDRALAWLEHEIVREANLLHIGTMGFGGAVTLLACKATALNRLPASFFVSVSYNCWALRRLGVRIDGKTGAIKQWLHREEPAPAPLAARRGLALTGKEAVLVTPLGEAAVRGLEVGQVVLVNGTLHTGRDAVHRQLARQKEPLELQGGAIYHCGPLAVEEEDHWRIVAAGPTTSSRQEPYQADVIRRYGVRAVIGKGGMGARTARALADHGAVYLSAVGGAAQLYAARVERVLGVDFLDFGIPEAMWHLRVKNFPAVVTMDAHGRSLHEDVRDASTKALREFAAPAID
jgi:fumarate hydratase class I